MRAAGWEELAEGELLSVKAGGHDIALARVDGTVYALLDQCSHEDLPLSAGYLDGDRLECTWHGAHFDVCSGRALTLPAVKPVRVFPVEIRASDIYVDVG